MNENDIENLVIIKRGWYPRELVSKYTLWLVTFSRRKKNSSHAKRQEKRKVSARHSSNTLQCMILKTKTEYSTVDSFMNNARDKDICGVPCSMVYALQHLHSHRHSLYHEQWRYLFCDEIELLWRHSLPFKLTSIAYTLDICKMVRFHRSLGFMIRIMW